LLTQNGLTEPETPPPVAETHVDARMTSRFSVQQWVVCRHVSEDVPFQREKWDVSRHVSEDVPEWQ